MSRMKKTDALIIGQKLAHKVAWPLEDAQAVEENLDYYARNQMFLDMAARQVTLESLSNADFAASPYRGSATDACAEAIAKLWYRPIQELDNKRKAWRRAAAGTDIKEARTRIADLLKSFNLRGARQYSEGLTLEVERAGESVTLYVRLDGCEFRTDGLVNPDNENQKLYTYEGRTEMSWSGTTRTVAQAVVAMKLYQELTEVAAEVEATLARMSIIRIYDSSPATLEEKVAAILA